MIKGINRQMIEIVDTGNPYFERAFLVVQPGISQPDSELLHRQAQDLLQNTGSCSLLRRQRARELVGRIGLCLLSALGGAALALFIPWILTR